MVPGPATRVRSFSGPVWIAGSAAFGFLAGVAFAVLVWVALAIALTPAPDIALRHELALIAGVALLSLPAIGQRQMLHGCGIDIRGYFTATMLGGWIAWNLPILAFGRLERIDRLHRFEEIDIGIALFAVALLLGAVAAGWLQSLTMPPALRRRWCRRAPIAALLANAAALAVAFLFVRASWDVDWRVRDPILGGLALATGWGVYAGLMARPIRRALREMAAAISSATDAPRPAVAAGSAISEATTADTRAAATKMAAKAATETPGTGAPEGPNAA